jgi:hypothetical protein
MRDLGYDQGSPLPDHQEQHDSNDDVDGAIEPVPNAPVGEEAEQVDVPLVCQSAISPSRRCSSWFR